MLIFFSSGQKHIRVYHNEHAILILQDVNHITKLPIKEQKYLVNRYNMTFSQILKMRSNKMTFFLLIAGINL
jgi:hypothetical protein